MPLTPQQIKQIQATQKPRKPSAVSGVTGGRSSGPQPDVSDLGFNYNYIQQNKQAVKELTNDQNNRANYLAQNQFANDWKVASRDYERSRVIAQDNARTRKTELDYGLETTNRNNDTQRHIASMNYAASALDNSAKMADIASREKMGMLETAAAQQRSFAENETARMNSSQSMLASLFSNGGGYTGNPYKYWS